MLIARFKALKLFSEDIQKIFSVGDFSQDVSSVRLDENKLGDGRLISKYTFMKAKERAMRANKGWFGKQVFRLLLNI